MMNTSPARKRTVFHDLAIAALVLPAVGLCLSVILLAAKVPWENRIRAIPAGMNVVAILAAVIALIGVARHGARGILLPAALGVALAAGLLTYSLVLTRHSAVRGADSFLDFGGWVGAAEMDGVRISVISLSPESPASRAFAAVAGTNVVVFSIALDNSRGTNEVVATPSDMEIIYADATRRRCLSPEVVLSGVQTNKERLLGHASGMVRASAGQMVADLSAYFPPDTDASKIVGVALPVNGKISLIPGQYLLSEQKKKIRGQASSPPQVPSAPK